jgi:FG-GAP repeat
MEFLGAATHPSIGGWTRTRARATVPRWLWIAAPLLSLVVGPVLFESVASEHSASPVAAHHRLAPQEGLSTLPLAAQGVASAALGADDPAYRISASGTGFQAQNLAERLHMRFGISGVQIGSRHTQVGLSLRGVGYGTSLQAIGSVRPSARGNRVTYAHAGVSEWYANGPLGLEQGFTLPRRPHTGEGPLLLSIRLRGSLVPEQTGSRVLFRNDAGAAVLSYGLLSAVDATGRRQPAHIQLGSGTLRLLIDDRHARYPLRIDPFVQQGTKLTANGEIGLAGFGSEVALSSDGNTALIGGEGDNEAGAVWVFTRSGESWTQQAKLTPSNAAGPSQFGKSVALSADGNTALIGSGGFQGVAAAWVFTRSGSTWTQEAKLITGAAFIGQVALSSDGRTALLAGCFGGSCEGAVWILTRSAETWTQQAKLTMSQHSEGEFGDSVALSSDGTTALVGGGADNGSVGAAWVFTRYGEMWTQQGPKLTGGEEIGRAGFGSHMALSSDGSTALIGGNGDNSQVGAAWVFTRSGSTWAQQGKKLTGTGEIGQGDFGGRVALASDGSIALIGGEFDNYTLSGPSGAVWVFARSGETWSQQGPKLTGSEQIGPALFGSGVALSADGGTALIGGCCDNGAIGAAWVFVNVNLTHRRTCGNTTVGKTSHQLSANVKRVNACQLPVNAVVSELVQYLTPTSQSGEQLIKGIVYADDKGKPGRLLGVTEQLTFKSTNAPGWYPMAFKTPLKLAAGKYWIGNITGETAGVAAEHSTSVKAIEDANANIYTSGPSNPFGSFKQNDEQVSLYAVYTAAVTSKHRFFKRHKVRIKRHKVRIKRHKMRK